MKRSAILFVALFVAVGLHVLALGAAQAADDLHGGDHKHQSVRITNVSVRPAVLQIHDDEAIGWLNYSRQRAVISFDDDVAKNLTCTAKSAFRLTGGRLESAPIQSRQFASLCTLAPGEYEYDVQLMSGVGSNAALGRKLVGKIIVQ